ncbi:hypothetical protein GFS31_20360 [Leptolyngbya sp. BL0902]|nr:hypothetical protein [Leptolyngbya sp. BL0902]QQE65349.1 hypothetical protein GFS31_20360 [Leptolyngbya sp. BL0902]
MPWIALKVVVGVNHDRLIKVLVKRLAKPNSWLYLFFNGNFQEPGRL